MKRMAALAILTAAILAWGCTSDRLAARRWNDTPSMDAAASLRPYVIFDRYPGTAVAADFTTRSDWPSTDYGYALHERIEFRENTYDLQGRGRHDDNDVQRRFSTRRVGLIER